MRTRSFVLTIVLLCVACRGSLVATAKLAGSGSVELELVPPPLAKLVVWADCDADWEGSRSSKPQVDYVLAFSKGGTVLGEARCSTSQRGGVSVCGGTTNIMGSHSGDCEYLLDCALPALPPGPVRVRVTATTGANVTATRNVSLNFREE